MVYEYLFLTDKKKCSSKRHRFSAFELWLPRKSRFTAPKWATYFELRLLRNSVRSDVTGWTFRHDRGKDVGGRTARSASEKKGGKYCVAGTVSGISCKNGSYTPNVSVHKFPADPAMRNVWVKFVRKHMPHFTPSGSSVFTVVFCSLRSVLLHPNEWGCTWRFIYRGGSRIFLRRGWFLQETPILYQRWSECKTLGEDK